MSGTVAPSSAHGRDSGTARRLATLWNVTFGDAALAAFVLCVISGVLLLPGFDSRDGVRSIAHMLLANPGAAVLRNLHYWTAQACLLLTVLHVWDHLRRGREGRLARGVWLRLVASVPVFAFLMLSGFLLRGDADAQQARRILEEMLALVPLAGPAVSQFLLGGDRESLQVIFLQHAATATIVVWLVVMEHARRIWGTVRAWLLTTVGCGALALLISPGLHDGMDTAAVKGPWYFLGLQELLHWSTWPAWLLLAGAAALVLLAWIPEARPAAAARAKGGLFATVALYMLLCFVVLFGRGDHWRLEFAWPDGSGDLRAGPVLERVTVDAARVPLPVVLGRPEGCLACHGAMTGFSPAHQPEAVGCSSCHGGDPFTLDAKRAHRGMVLVPGNIADAPRSCGQAACHADVVPRVERSIMATFAGVIITNRRVFGEDPHAGAAPGQPPHARDLGHSPADRHMRELCVSCHLGEPKTLWGPIDQNARGGGCNACHLKYSADAKEQLDLYAPDWLEPAVGRPVPLPPAGRPFPTVHPRLSVHADNQHCFGCHSRSGRISTSYEGWHEMRGEPDAAELKAHANQYRQLQDGRYFERKTPDVHHAAGMDCIDCHTALEVMGSGHTVANKMEALRVRCEDCHAAPGAKLASRDVKEIDPESSKILALRNWKLPPPGQRVGATRSGDTLLNITVDAAGRGTLRRKGDSRIAPLKPQAAACSGDKGHEKLSCNSCHTAWAPQCISCHTSFDPASKEGFDFLDWKEVKGEWKERTDGFNSGPPALGVRRADGRGERGGEIIDTFVPGMIMTLDRNMKAGASPDLLFHRLFAPAAAHTTQRASRSCTSCHNDPVALGYGQGKLVFEPGPVPPKSAVAAGGRTGTWHFVPKEAALPQDGLPADAWTGFLAARTDRASTHDGARPFSVAEQQRILNVGACLTCHAGDSAPMRATLRDFDGTVKRRAAQCALPQWNK